MWKSAKDWIKASKANKIIALITAVLFLTALASAYDSYRHRGMLAEAKKAEKEQAVKIETLTKEGIAKDEAFRRAIGATEPALESALAGVKKAEASLAQAEAARRGVWMAPAVDNGELVARFEKAIEAIK